MLSGLWDELHDVLVILISIIGQVINVAITFSFANHGWMSYYISSFIFCTLYICAQSIIFTTRFLPCHPVYAAKDYIKPTCHALLFLVIGFCVAPLVPLIIYFMELYVNKVDIDEYQLLFLDYNQLNRNRYRQNKKCFRMFGCVYVQYHESLLNQWMHFKFAKLIGFMPQLIIDTLPHLIIQTIFLFKKASNNKLNEIHDQRLFILIEISVFIAILSILLKTFIFGHGFTNKIYIFSWMCYVTDFLNIIFIIFVVFYGEDSLKQFTYLGLDIADNIFSRIFMFFLSYILIPIATLPSTVISGVILYS